MQTRRLWTYALAFSCVAGFIVIVLNISGPRLFSTVRRHPARPKTVDIGARACQMQTRRLWTYALAFSCVAGFIVIVLNISGPRLFSTARRHPARPKTVDIGARARQMQTRRLWTYALVFSCVAGFIVIVLNNFQDQMVFYGAHKFKKMAAFS
ncbi:unnamed protein product [Linum tenue]|uniref:Uncharacterized protein n=1 Tax=Linum tenue TaxID=586396 RepID=A0AAV0GP43_9ROSI|nr:unnamed protein product [Linum tenue]